MKKSVLSIVIISLMFLAWGCYPDGPDYIEEMDVVLTYHPDTYDFDSKATYAMPDRIVKITGNVAEGDEPVYIPDITAEKILSQIEDNMDAYGWERVEDVTDTANIDLLLFPASWETTTIIYYYNYWDWWYGGYYPYWGYPPYYSYGGSYSTGTLLMSLIDPDELAANGEPVVQWSGALTGILTSTYDASRMDGLIDKAFDQSPYLKTN